MRLKTMSPSLHTLQAMWLVTRRREALLVCLGAAVGAYLLLVGAWAVTGDHLYLFRAPRSLFTMVRVAGGQPVIVDATRFTDGDCTRQVVVGRFDNDAAGAAAMAAKLRGADMEQCPLPFHSWAVALSPRWSISQRHTAREPYRTGFSYAVPSPREGWVPAVPCAWISDACRAAALDTSSRELMCPATPAAPAAQCTFTNDLRRAPAADGIILTHVGLSGSELSDASMVRTMLTPPERTRHKLWALRIMFESTAYYPAGNTPSVLSLFDFTYGSSFRTQRDLFKMSYRPPPWAELAVQVDWAAKAALAARLSDRADVVWVTSNCDSRSGRYEYMRALMQVLRVDSFGLCLNNRDAGPLAMAEDRSNFQVRRRPWWWWG
jgi:hypothetical protein